MKVFRIWAGIAVVVGWMPAWAQVLAGVAGMAAAIGGLLAG